MKKLEKLLKHLQKLALKKKRKPAFLLAPQKKITKKIILYLRLEKVKKQYIWAL
tara:strand:+ start:177 stop:338 length:162 start_codon:yes stop_codon:yes gene_type:complete